MFRFGKSKKNPESAASSEDDLLADSEAAEFEASVKQARERARQRQTTPPPPAADPIEEEIVWNEQEDVYRPTPVHAADFLLSLSLSRPVALKRGQTVLLVRPAAFEKIQAHLRSDLRIELGGLLVGRVLQDAALSITLILLEDALLALDGHGTPTTFEYTPASWKAITPQLQQMHSDQTIVGSYHSHPGHGVFMSPTDKETQANIFDHEWQIALVVDPIREEVGFFLGEKCVPCPHWRFLDEM
jgi:proteasome lid subunit RPN8/RPN11